MRVFLKRLSITLVALVMGFTFEPLHGALLDIPDTLMPQSPQWVGFANEQQFQRTPDQLIFTADGKLTNSHIDIEVKLKANVPYVYGVSISHKGSNISPTLRIAHMNWTTLSMITCQSPAQSGKHSNLFTVDQDMTVRVQFFGYRLDHARQGAPSGKAVFSDFYIRKATDAELGHLLQSKVEIDCSTTLSQTSPLFKGGNSLYWIDTPQFYQRADYVKALKAMGMTVLRFPAGEAADDYDWRVAKGNIPFVPSQTAGQSGILIDQDIQFDQFVGWAQTIGAQPIIVVNLETSLANGNIQQGIELAKQWVHYSNKIKGYNIKYWEIGNESYLRGGHYPLTAAEYAQAFVQFADAMKQVDPTIQVGANGPSRVYSLGLMDRLPEGKLEAFRSMSRIDRKTPAIRDVYFQSADQVTDKSKAWWPTLVKLAGRKMDFAVIHHYVNTDERPRFNTIGTRPLDNQRHFQHLREYLAKETGKTIALALTEWDVFHTVKQMTPYQAALTNVEMAFDAMNAGVEMSCFWPMRWPEGRWDELAMFTADAQPRPTYFAMKQLFENLGDRTLACKVSGSRELFAASTADVKTGQVHCFLINRCGVPKNMTVDLPRLSNDQPVGKIMTADRPTQWLSAPVHQRDGHWQVQLPAQSMMMVTWSSVDHSRQ